MTIGTYFRILLNGVVIGYVYHDEINEGIELGARAAVKGYRFFRRKLAQAR